MPKYLKPFLMGALCIVATAIMVLWALDYKRPDPVDGITVEDKQGALAISSDTVLITALPSYRTLNGINVAFRGKKRYLQKFVGRYAQNITIVSFRATGEHAYKSTILITWEDDSTEIVSAGVTNIRFSAEKRAKEIVVQGYSVHERKVFRDSIRDGVLNWEILYEPVE
jgi:hypothetical protein